MEIKDIYSKTQKFISIACSLPLEDVVVENQGKPRDLKPYISFYLRSFRSISQPIVRKLDEDGVQTIITPTVCTASFKAVSDSLWEAESFLHKLRNAFNTELQNSIFNGELALLRVLKSVSAIPTEVDLQTEGRAILDLELNFNVTTKDNVGIIEKINVEDILSSRQYTIQKEV